MLLSPYGVRGYAKVKRPHDDMTDSSAGISNRQARRDYFIFETFEAGIALKGSEIKSIRKGRANLKNSFARVEKKGVLLYNMHVTPYEFARREELDPKRPRKLLLRKSEIRHLIGKTSVKGATLIPLRMYFKGSLAKVEIGLAKGKNLYDKRETIKKRAAEREIDRALHRKKH